MNTIWKTVIWRQSGAAIDMLENAMRACPDVLWDDASRGTNTPGFWYIAYHTLFFLDYYLSGSAEGFAPPAPFTLDELDPAGLMPERTYTKDELLIYLEHGREKCRAVISALTGDTARRPCGFERFDMPAVELLLQSLRHVQHHAAQMNLLLRQSAHSAPQWVAQAKA